jgi:hypothetical protein
MRNAHAHEHKGEDFVRKLGLPAFLGHGTSQFLSPTGRPGSGKSIWMPILLDRSPLMARKGVR